MNQEIITSVRYPYHMYQKHNNAPNLLITNRLQSIIIPDHIMTSIKNHSYHLSKCYYDDDISIIIDDSLDRSGLAYLLDAILSIHYNGTPMVCSNNGDAQTKYIVSKYDLGMMYNDNLSYSNDIGEYDDLPSLESISDDGEYLGEYFSDSDND